MKESLFRPSKTTTRSSIPRTIGVASVAVLLLAVAVPTAGATVASGVFSVKAENIDNPEINAIYGANFKSSEPEGPTDPEPEVPKGPADPADVVNSPVVFSYICGPMKLEITEAMVEFSNYNIDLVNEGKAADVVKSKQGWAYFTNGSASLKLTKTSTRPATIYLGTKSMTSNTTNAGFAYLGTKNASLRVCEIADKRNAPKAGERFSYTQKSSSVVAERRYQMADGAIIVEEGILENARNSAETLYGARYKLANYPDSYFWDSSGSGTGNLTETAQNALIVSNTVPAAYMSVPRENPARPFIRYAMKQSTGMTEIHTVNDRVTDILNGFELGYIGSTRAIPDGIRFDEASGAPRAFERYKAHTNWTGVPASSQTTISVSAQGKTLAQAVADWNAAAKASWDGKIFDYSTLSKKDFVTSPDRNHQLTTD